MNTKTIPLVKPSIALLGVCLCAAASADKTIDETAAIAAETHVL